MVTDAAISYPPLCNICVKLFPVTGRSPFVTNHHLSPHDLEKSAKTCSLCAILSQSLNSKVKTARLKSDTKSPCQESPGFEVIIPQYDDKLGTKSVQIQCVNVNRGCIHHQGQYLKVLSGDSMLSGNLCLYLGNWLTKIDPLSHHYIWHDRLPNFESRFTQIKEWFNECRTNHFLCEKDSDLAPELPTRVVDVGEFASKTVRLVVSNGIRSQYVALSHCWGLAQPLRTMSSTFDAHTKSISVDALPKTFRDAIEIVRFLGIQYLWIDSLCIIQDDAQDWEVEAARMTQVYHKATITLAATASSSSDGGLLQQFIPSSKFVSPNGAKWFVRQEVQPNDILSNEPLNKRAWTLQETILSSRLVHFASDQMYWECFCTKTSEDRLHSYDGPSLPKHNGYGTRGPSPMDRQFAFKATIRAMKMPEFDFLSGSLKDAWCDLMSDYMSRSLTFRKDKLPALAGLTDYFISVQKDDPLLGLWKRSLRWDLSWHSLGFVTRLTSRSSKEPTIPLPSWTFLSIEGNIKMRPNWLNGNSLEPTDLDILEVGISWTGLPMTSPLSSTILKVSGQLREATVISDPIGEGNEFRILNHDISRFGDYLGWCWLDTNELVGKDRPLVWFLNVGKVQTNLNYVGKDPDYISVLALSPLDSHMEKFCRIGSGFFWPRAMLTETGPWSWERLMAYRPKTGSPTFEGISKRVIEII